MLVVGLAAEVMVAEPGFATAAVQTPVPVAAIVVEVLVGKQEINWSGPALGAAETVTAAVSVHIPIDHTKW
jgi:hypothetical protein